MNDETHNSNVIAKRFNREYGKSVRSVIRLSVKLVCERPLSQSSHAERLGNAVNMQAHGNIESYEQLLVLPYEFGATIEARGAVIAVIGGMIDGAMGHRHKNMLERSEVRSHWSLDASRRKWKLDLQAYITRIH